MLRGALELFAQFRVLGGHSHRAAIFVAYAHHYATYADKYRGCKAEFFGSQKRAYYNVPAMCRASLAMYNTHEEVDRLVTGLQRIHRLLG